MLDRHQDRTAPFTSQGKALDEPARDEQRRCPCANLRVVRQQTDRERGESHQHQRPHEHELASEPIAEMPHDDAAKGTGDEADGKGGKGGEGAGEVGNLWEELRSEDNRGGCPVDEEVVPLDGGTDGARDSHATRLGGAPLVGQRWDGRGGSDRPDRHQNITATSIIMPREL
jgi:hypothetical protein